MRIGILTLPLHTNYGGVLQAYALQTVLERMGHKVVVFDTSNKYSLPPLWKLPISLAKRLLLKCMGRIDRIFIERYNNRVQPVITKEIQLFVDSKIHRKIISKFSRIKANEFDAIVVGSDQVWRSDYFLSWNCQSIENAYLSFAKKWSINRIAYATSFGLDSWGYNEKQTEQCRQLLKKFDAVSVREDSAVKLCKQYFDVDALHVLDPTMLLDANDYIMLFEQKQTPKSKGTLLNYVLDETEEIRKIINLIASKKSMVPFAVNNPYAGDDTKPG